MFDCECTVIAGAFIAGLYLKTNLEFFWNVERTSMRWHPFSPGNIEMSEKII